MLVQEFSEWLSSRHSYSTLTVSAYVRDIRMYLSFLSEQYDCTPEQATRPVIRTYLAILLEKGAEKSTVNRKVASLKVFYNFLNESKILPENPVRNIKTPKITRKLPQFFSESEMSKMLDGKTDSLDFTSLRKKLIMELLYGTGVRVSELTGLKISDVFIDDSLIRVTGKGNKERYIPYPQTLKKLLETYLELRNKKGAKTLTLLITEKGNPVYRQMIYRMVRQTAGQVSTLQKRSPHVLRHTYATHLLNRGADLNAVKELLGHSSLAATEKYTHTTFEHLKKIHKKNHPRG